MPKFQIILEGDESLPDDELYDFMKKVIGERFKIIEARNLEGIKPEVWRRTDVSDLI